MPVLNDKKDLLGTVIEYRIFTVLVYKKTLLLPPDNEKGYRDFVYGF